MQRRVPVQQLRGSDATLLEVQLPNLLRRPLGQLAPENALDLLALAESESRPRAVVRQLEGFVERAHREIQDMTGGQMLALLGELENVDPSRVPETFRTWIQAEIGRADRSDSALSGALEAWSEVVPEPFLMGERQARVQRAAAGNKPRSAVPTRRGRAPGVPSSRAESTSRSAAAPRLDLRSSDPGKDEVIRRICMERLNGATDKGLAEAVLVAGVRHRAKSEGYEDVTPAEVTAILRDLKNHDRVRQSAGRWMSNVRRW